MLCVCTKILKNQRKKKRIGKAKNVRSVLDGFQNYFGLSQDDVLNIGIKIESEVDLVKWARICSSASVYSILSMFIKDNPGCFSEESANAVRESCLASLGKLIEIMHRTITDDGLRTSARKILCDYWGSDFVGKVERQWIETRSKK